MICTRVATPVTDRESRAVALMKKGKKIVCGSQDGLLSIFDFNDISVRFPEHTSTWKCTFGMRQDGAF